MIESKIYLGDLLANSAGNIVQAVNSFFPEDDTIEVYDSYAGIKYKIDREDLYPPSEKQARILKLMGILSIDEKYNGFDKESRVEIKKEIDLLLSD